ncbi:uncharacterized [Tachysurus ichikawai]
MQYRKVLPSLLVSFVFDLPGLQCGKGEDSSVKKHAREHIRYIQAHRHTPTYPPGGIPHMDEMSDGMLLQVDNGYYMQPDIYEELSGNLSKPSLHLQAAQPAGRGMFHQEEQQKCSSWEK